MVGLGGLKGSGDVIGQSQGIFILQSPLQCIDTLAWYQCARSGCALFVVPQRTMLTDYRP
jgi:hypothetical protein